MDKVEHDEAADSIFGKHGTNHGSEPEAPEDGKEALRRSERCGYLVRRTGGGAVARPWYSGG